MTSEEIKFLCTRFAHQCRLKGASTNNDTCNLFDEWIKTQEVSNIFEMENDILYLQGRGEELKQSLANAGGEIVELKESDAPSFAEWIDMFGWKRIEYDVRWIRSSDDFIINSTQELYEAFKGKTMIK